jgi:hypothetical protein
MGGATEEAPSAPLGRAPPPQLAAAGRPHHTSTAVPTGRDDGHGGLGGDERSSGWRDETTLFTPREHEGACDGAARHAGHAAAPGTVEGAMAVEDVGSEGEEGANEEDSYEAFEALAAQGTVRRG